MKRLRAELALVGVTVIWGTTFVLVKAALADVTPILFLALRFVLACLVLAVCFRRFLRPERIGPAVLAGSLLFGAYVFQTVGLQFTTAAKSAFLTSFSVPLVPLAGSLVYKNRPRLLEVLGIAVAALGTVLMTLPAGQFQIGLGDWLSILCALTFAMHIVVVGHFAPITGFQSLAVIQTLVAALFSSLAWSAGAVWSAAPLQFHVSAAVVTAVLVTGLLATALAFTAQAWAQQYTSATRAALIFALEPVVAWYTGWLAGGEGLVLRGKIGAGLILGGILLVELKRSEVAGHRYD